MPAARRHPVAPRDAATVDRFLRRRARVRRVLLTAAAALGSTVVLGNARQRWLGGDDWSRFDRRTFVVPDVPSGDTVVIREPGGLLTTVRLAGVDAPDPPPDAPATTRWAAGARQALAERLVDRDVLVRLPPLAPRAADGTLLAYLYLPGAAGTVNEQVIADGHGYADRRTPHPTHKQFEQAESEARRKRRGLWADVRDDQQPAWRQAWLRGLREERTR